MWIFLWAILQSILEIRAYCRKNIKSPLAPLSVSLKINKLYQSITAGTYLAPSIKVAEAANN
jgi:hypothetical protein